MTIHPPRHCIEELLAGPQRNNEVRAHVDGCAECAARLQTMREARAVFVSRRDPESFARAVAERSRALPSLQKPTPLLRRAAFALAAAAIALVGIRVAMPDPTAIRFKGEANLQVFVQRDGRAEAVTNGQALASGERLAFVYTLAEPRTLLLLSIDESGAVTRYFPTDEGGTLLPPAARAQLPVGVELDAHRGEERLFALFSRDPIDERHVTEALREALREARARGQGIAGMSALELPVQQSSLWFRKP